MISSAANQRRPGSPAAPAARGGGGTRARPGPAPPLPAPPLPPHLAAPEDAAGSARLAACPRGPAGARAGAGAGEPCRPTAPVTGRREVRGVRRASRARPRSLSAGGGGRRCGAMSRPEAEPCSRALAQARVYLGQLRSRVSPAGPEGGGRRDYLVEAARQLRLALERDVSEDYEEAFNHYQNGVDVLLRGVQGAWGLPAGRGAGASLRRARPWVRGTPLGRAGRGPGRPSGEKDKRAGASLQGLQPGGRGIPTGRRLRGPGHPSGDCGRGPGYPSRERCNVTGTSLWGAWQAPHARPLRRPQLTPTRSVGRP